MIIRKLTTEHDWSYGHSQSDYLDLNRGLALNIETKLYEWYKDCFFNREAGIDWATRLGMHLQKDWLDNDIENIITAPDEVVSLESFESTVDNQKRTYSCKADIISIYSTEALSIIFSTEGITGNE